MDEDVDWSQVDIDDPCSLYSVLYPKYLALMAGEAVQEIEIDGRRMKLAQTSVKSFGEFVNKLKAECLAKTNGRRRRFAAVSKHCS